MVRRLILCSGKIYYELAGHESRAENPDVAIGRVELLYPFPQAEILALVESYPNLEEVVWVQEEPRNMGARAHMSPRLMQILPAPPEVRLHRPARAGGLAARATRWRTRPSSTGSSTPRSTSARRSRSTRASCPANASGS